MKVNKKEQILEALEDGLVATKVRWPGGESIRVDFIKNGKKAHFIYNFIGDENTYGIQECNYDEEDGEDVYQDIHDWVDEHIKFEVNMYYNGEKLKR